MSKKPYTNKELKEYIEECYSWVNEHPTVLMHMVAKWIEEKHKSQKK